MTRRRKKLLLAFASFLLLIFAFFVAEHYRGKWMLNRWKTRVSRAGEELNIDKLAPPPPRPEENGFSQFSWAAARLGNLPPELSPPSAKYAAPGRCIVVADINEWHTRGARQTNMVTWAQVAGSLASAEPVMQEALEALQSEAFQSNIDYRNFFNVRAMHVRYIWSLAHFLSTAMFHDLHQGQPEAAFTKLQGVLAVPEVLRDEPLVISQLVRIKAMHGAFTATWQGLQSGDWSDEQLALLQQTWSSYDFLRPMERALAMERLMAVGEYEQFRAGDLPLSTFLDGGAAPPPPQPSLLSWDWVARMFDFRERVFTPMWKFAWSHQDELRYCEMTQAMLEAHRKFRPANTGLSAVAEVQRIETTHRVGLYDQVRFVMSRNLVGALSTSLMRAWLAQTTAEIARAAIALKRYELRSGRRPATLDELVPQFLPSAPIDYMNGRPLRYCLEDESFLLYSVGQDGRDGGGDLTHTSNSATFQNGRDMVWPRAASDEEVARWRVSRR